MLKKYCKINASDFAASAIVLAGIFLVTHIITLIALALTHEHSSVLLSGALLPISSGFILGVVALSTILLAHDLNQTFGCTRRRSLALIFGQLLTELVMCLVLCWGFTALEKTLFPTLWKTLFHFDQLQFSDSSTFAPAQLANVLFIEDFSLSWFWPVLILLGAMILGIVAGTIIRRFGGKGGWSIWLFFMLTMFFITDLTHSPWFPVILTVGAVLLVLAFCWSIYELLHSPVHI